MAMGQGQADLALATLRECSRSGDWLCLKNLHLVTAWLPLLEKVRMSVWTWVILCMFVCVYGYSACVLRDTPGQVIRSIVLSLRQT